jgi:hypothetical protein
MVSEYFSFWTGLSHRLALKAGAAALLLRTNPSQTARRLWIILVYTAQPLSGTISLSRR